MSSISTVDDRLFLLAFINSAVSYTHNRFIYRSNIISHHQAEILRYPNTSRHYHQVTFQP